MGTGTQGAVGARELARALELLARTARARRSAPREPAQGASTTASPSRMAAELRAMIEGLTSRSGPIALDVGPTSFSHRDRGIEESIPAESLAPVLFRDGITRVELHPGLELAELEVFIGAAARGLGYGGLGDDAASVLADHELPHVRVTMSAPEGPPLQVLEGLLGELFGDGASPLGPRAVLEQLALPPEGTTDPECHPVRSLRLKPSYAAELLGELGADGGAAVSARLVDALVDASAARLLPADAVELATTLAARYEAALRSGDLDRAATLLEALGRVDIPEHRARLLLDAATAEAKLRQALAAHRASPTSELTEALVRLLRAAGPRSVPLVLGSIPGTIDAVARRRLSELALALGIDDDAKVKELLRSDQAPVIQEAIFILQGLGTKQARGVLATLESDGRWEARVALAEQLAAFPEDEGVAIGARLLDDPSPQVRAAAARGLVGVEGFAAAKALDAKAQRLEGAGESLDVKIAVLESYALSNPAQALRHLSALAAKAEGLLVKDEAEALGVAAVYAMAKIPTQRSLGILKKLVVSRNKRIRETAHELLVRMKEAAT